MNFNIKSAGRVISIFGQKKNSLSCSMAELSHWQHYPLQTLDSHLDIGKDDYNSDEIASSLTWEPEVTTAAPLWSILWANLNFEYPVADLMLADLAWITGAVPVRNQVRNQVRINTLTLIWQVLRLQTIKAIVNSRSFKSPKSDEPRRV